MLNVADILDRCTVVSLPMRLRFRGVTQREAVLIDGPCGWGEFAPFKEYDACESASWLESALEMAYEGPPVFHRSSIPINATIPAVAPDKVEEILARFPGCDTVKVKIAEPGQSLKDDIARVAAVREILPLSKIRVDANGALTVAEAVKTAHALGPLDYLEQPCASVIELAELRQQLIRAGLFIRVAADESIRRVRDPYEVAKKQAVDVAVIKAAPMGGPRRVGEIAEFMRSRGLDITVSSALDMGVGMNAGIAAVAALPRMSDDEEFDVPPAAAGLGTQQFFVEDITPKRTIEAGHIAVEMLDPCPDRLAEFRLNGKDKDWWFDRLTQCFAYLDR
ncbi:O-succinylbenzoate synthase [Corynebacterium kutscheri]|uniref:o-succinylbenzoate synthase n=1 Tax=Corynebacterium kutscheri TaxID=35755 RepID=A0A0F6QYD4_9CORY|nr:o-succinylbenzoate synthase [Corynebacterium kutscheri]AKE40502.1 Mandelate racemase / muconate lactonizing enzyme, C-terminal domain/Enolase C-terminal domain [Corynebacterium kutscheri]VEH05075.1 O-succinylbenzoate synthase [Corynebacterium kutscheri]VEH10897.1 O-succinylbenzoate synthase [Corynebacterium kutscheri]VEH80626.1 O-succinylbenzoate synthase [Corynebacterium kutscheri]